MFRVLLELNEKVSVQKCYDHILRSGNEKMPRRGRERKARTVVVFVNCDENRKEEPRQWC